jgi:hypothetical protein
MTASALKVGLWDSQFGIVQTYNELVGMRCTQTWVSQNLWQNDGAVTAVTNIGI